MTETKPGRILHLQRLSTEDGPGIRTTVFFKGCPLACTWCHNPEGISPHPQVQWLENRCIGCHTCLGVCPNHCLEEAKAGIRIDRQRCDGCGACADACPANAVERLGTTVTVEELLREVGKDRVYYETSGGGVTVSGGEPLMQPEFAAALLSRAKESGIATALDTCGLVGRQSLERVLPHVDLLLFDLKEIDTERHRTFTGQGNELILEALSFIGDTITAHRPDMRLWIRTPLIPGATATRENLAGLGAFIAHHLDGLVERWELCAFNNLCRDKYRRLDLAWPFAATPLLATRRLQELEAWARESVVNPEIVIATGATRDER